MDDDAQILNGEIDASKPATVDIGEEPHLVRASMTD